MNKDWIEKDGIASYIQTVYDMVARSVADYGYNMRFPDSKGEVAGRASDQVEYMAVFIKPGKQEDFVKAAASMGISIKQENLNAPGAKEPSPCYTFNSGSFANMNNKMFRQIVRRAVKDEQARMAMMAHASEMHR